MKKILSLFCLLLWPIMLSADWSDWNTYQTVYSGETPMVVIEYRTYTSKNWSPTVQWRVSNCWGATLYDVAIGKRSYRFGADKQQHLGSEYYGHLAAGERHTFYADGFGKDGDLLKDIRMEYIHYRHELDSELIKQTL